MITNINKFFLEQKRLENEMRINKKILIKESKYDDLLKVMIISFNLSPIKFFFYYKL